jgi:hypothetical protein
MRKNETYKEFWEARQEWGFRQNPKGMVGIGKTPEIAVAKLYLKLNNHN